MVEEVISVLIAGAKIVAQQATNDTFKAVYARLKALIGAKLPDVNSNLTQIEENPESEERQGTLANSLRVADAVRIEEIRTLVAQLRREVEALGKRGGDDTAGTADTDSDLSQIGLLISLDPESKRNLVAEFAVGPAVDILLVPVDRIANSLSRDSNAASARAIIQNANRLRISVDPGFQEDSMIITDLPNPDVVGFFSYWWCAVDQSLTKGPRMAVSLLLSLPLITWMQYGRDAYRALEEARSNA